jgi:antitoxin CcdA
MKAPGALLKKAHDLAPLEDSPAEEMLKRNRELWLRENREAIETYNELVVRQGVFSDGSRGF